MGRELVILYFESKYQTNLRMYHVICLDTSAEQTNIGTSFISIDLHIRCICPSSSIRLILTLYFPPLSIGNRTNAIFFL